MASSSIDEVNQRPHKRTGVWANETVKPKASTDIAPKRYSRKYSPDVPSSTENDDGSDQYKKMCNSVGEINSNSAKSRLLKLPALNSLSNSNVALLLNEFNDESEIQEIDSPWNQDSLFAELTSTLNKGSSLS